MVGLGCGGVGVRLGTVQIAHGKQMKILVLCERVVM